MAHADAPNAASVKSILLVDDEVSVALRTSRALTALGYEVATAGTVSEAMIALAAKPDLIVLDVRLPDGSGVDIARAALDRRPLPRIIIISGECLPAESFRLAKMGVIDFVQKPFGFAELEAAIRRAPISERDLVAVCRQAVGLLDLVQARTVLRDSMTAEALAVTGGNVTRAAALLGVTRQGVQRAMREAEDLESDAEPRFEKV